MANWYAVYTRPRWEKKVMETLSKKRIENYSPLTRVASQWGERKKSTYQPLFAAYVFVRVNSADLDQIRKIDGVINLLYWLGKPAVIRDIEIEMVKRFLSEHDSVVLEKGQVNVTEIVKITSVDHEVGAQVINMHKHKVKLVLPTLGYHLVAEVANEAIATPVPSAAVSLETSLANIG